MFYHQVLPFAAIGILCGLLGALFNATNTRLTRARKRFHQGRGKWLRVLEATLSVALVVSFFYGAALASSCREMPAELQALYSLWLYPVDGYPTMHVPAMVVL